MLPLRRGQKVADRYRLVEQLGVGGMSEVWRGHDEVLDRPVAVKVLTGSLADAELRGLIGQEARAMARLSHPNVTSVFDYGEFTTDGASVPFVVMELLHGQTLGRRLAGGPLPWPEAVRVVAQVAAALSAAHRQGLVHCDVTPANVMLTDSGVKVLDFGVAAVLGDTRSADGQPRFGTAGYIAPERLTPAVPVGPAVDVYGLGALLYEALVGQLPPPSQDRAEPTGALTASMPALMQVAGLPAEVADLCVRCLAHRRADRPDSTEVARILAAAIPGVPSGLAAEASASGTTPHRGTVPLPRPEAADTAPLHVAGPQGGMWPRPLLLAAAIVVAGLLLAGVYLLSASTPSQRATTPRAPTVSTAATATAPRPTPTRSTDLATVTALRQAVLVGQAAGEIREDCAEDLLSRIADLQSGLARGRHDDALHRIEQIRVDIDKCVEDGDITARRAADLRAALAAIVI